MPYLKIQTNREMTENLREEILKIEFADAKDSMWGWGSSAF